jgi:hypothetical protein
MDAADSSTMTLSSSSVTQWNDKSGNLRNASSNALSGLTYPSLSANTVTMTGTQGLTITSGFPSNPYCIFVVGAPLASTASWRTGIQLLGSGGIGNTHPIIIETGSTRFGNWHNQFNQYGALTWGGSNALAYVQLNADLTMNATMNGISTLTTSTPAVGAASASIIHIGNITGGAQPWGSFNEIIMYNSILSLTQRQQVESYLAQKWGFTGSLPAGHPGLGPTLYRSKVPLARLPYYKVFDPKTISSLALWLDAADSTTVTGSSPITAWTDKSSAGRTVTITSGPTYGTTTRYGLKTMSFNNNVISSSIASAVGSGDFTLIAVWYQSSAGTNTVLSLGTVASSSQSLGYSGDKYNFYQFGSLESAYTTGPGWVVQIGTRISSIKRLYITGTIGSVPASDSFNVTNTTVTIGKGDNFAITGEIAEIMVYTGTMSDTNRQLLEGYLSQKWGLTSSLPVNHPSLTLPVGAPETGVGKQTITYYPYAATSSPITSIILNTIATYLRNYMSEFRNPSFFGYSLDGDSYRINDGGNDMYDSGNFTYPWLIAGTQFTSSSGSQQVFSINYASTTATTVDTDFVYVSLGYIQSATTGISSAHPLTVLGFRTTTGRPVGFQLAGNSGADGGGTLASGILYAGSIIQGFTVHAFYRETYNAGDPSHCNLFILLGHPSWGSVFGTISSFADPVANAGNGCYFFTSGAGVSNILAIQTLLSKASGALVTAAECQTVVQAFVNRVKLAVGF